MSVLVNDVHSRLNATEVAEVVPVRSVDEVRSALDLIASDHFSPREPGIFAPLSDVLLTQGDHYMHLADLASYLEADGRLSAVYADPDSWTRKVIANVASSGKFSSDRTIGEYAAEIWHVKPCPVSW